MKNSVLFNFLHKERQPDAKRNEQEERLDVPGPVSTVLLTAVSFAILTGLGEFAVLFVSNYILHRYVYFWGAYLIWMAPLADLILFSIPAIFLSFIAWRWPKMLSLRLIVGIFAYLGFISLLFLYMKLSHVAVLILSAGLAVQTARLVEAHPRGYYQFLRYSVAWAGLIKRTNRQIESKVELQPEPKPASISRREFLISAGATMAGLTLGASGWDFAIERITSINQSTARPGNPNVLLIVLDTVRARNLSLYGYPRATSPQLVRLSKNGVLFKQAVSTASWTLPSHASMFTGRYPHQLSVGYNSGLNAAYPTLAEILRANGYETAGFVSNVWYCSRESGLNRGFTHYEDFTLSFGQILNSSSLARTMFTEKDFRRVIGWYDDLGRKPAPEMNSKFLNWLAQRDRSRPFFAFINFYDAHGPYLPPKPYDTLFGPKMPRVNPRHYVGWKWTPQQIQAEENAYDGSIAYLDHHLGQLFDSLENLGELENTLVILASDHGEEFLEHGVVDHGFSLYWTSLHVLLMLSYPGRVPAAVTIQAPVSMRNLPMTVLELTGIPDQGHFPGESLARLWENGSKGVASTPTELLSEVKFNPGYPRWYPVTRGDMKSLIFDDFHYIKNGDGNEELYDLGNDPLEKANLAHRSESQNMLQHFRKGLDTLT